MRHILKWISIVVTGLVGLVVLVILGAWGMALFSSLA